MQALGTTEVAEAGAPVLGQVAGAADVGRAVRCALCGAGSGPAASWHLRTRGGDAQGRCPRSGGICQCTRFVSLWGLEPKDCKELGKSNKKNSLQVFLKL